MRWLSHTIIGASVAIPTNPSMIPVVMFGSIFPDLLETILNLQPIKLYILNPFGLTGQIKHRTYTHVLVSWILLLLFSIIIFDFHNFLFWLSIGCISHWFADALTYTGVPLTWWSDRRVYLFGGRVRTGQPTELYIAFTCFAVALFFSQTFQWHDPSKPGFLPFFYDWRGEYSKGNIDGQEWRENRFKFI